MNLKRCPFCGSKAEVGGMGGHKDRSLLYYVMCANRACAATGSFMHSRRGAIGRWNRRSKESPGE